MPRYSRPVPLGFVKTSFEISVTSKWALEDLRAGLRRSEDAPSGISEAALVECLILTAAKEGVDQDMLSKVLRARKRAQDAPKTARK